MPASKIVTALKKISPLTASKLVTALKKINARLKRMDNKMADIKAAVTELTTAVQAMKVRIDTDVQLLLTEVQHLRDLLTQALATETADQAEIARLNAEGDAAVASITGAVAEVAAIDPVPDV